MKLLVILIIGLIVCGFFINGYYVDENETIKRSVNKFLGKECELKQLSNGWTQIENCAVYRIKGVDE